ncbi:TIGR02221 family CRISPR-associated protein [Desulfobacter hydrogenophilus]|uniref:TIGR02221 family CRISPR-associated protein n=1 Tax=Desulfobacter hydrogenophilus TaxID=2291 RepID=A0A328FCN9_9BACT|nr:TIGR02221 family CRISPR-associated protein [Desulfobacter hydrogenophilus]NDY71654.1 TIGR02221 family CRISPR-associated protein [Desulfobacter hydrogenophilus]QBH13168.1 TIGR02221 family CRISPR-associated protein [Desulfobacter hydrogenophilus]RAM02411.1 TIGR02221 family CRISPR-associated protein [Desulfobacter hydrogenophilus]
MGKIFISFLGTNNYKYCNYYFNDNESDAVKNVRFVQEALLKRHCSAWGKDDRALIFLTPEAETRNWQENDIKGKRVYGLDHHLSQLGLSLSIEPIKDIPMGYNESQIWQLFDLIIGEINEGDEIHLDITHGFRSLPMLGLVLVNYLKVTKEISVGGIYYGAFEKLGPGYEIENIPIEERNAPILNLTSFHILQDWVMGADNFINYGITGKIEQAISEEIKPVLKETRGQDPKAAALKKFNNQLKKIPADFQTVRGKEIIEGTDIQNLKEQIKNIKQYEQKAPLRNILDKISGKLAGFKENSVENGFAGVQWCIDHGMIQQGVTLLQENTITWVQTALKRNYTGPLNLGDYRDKDMRALVSQSFTILGNRIIKKKWIKPSKKYPDDATYIQNFIKKTGLLSAYASLSEYRNDINHGGVTIKKNKDGCILKTPFKSHEFKQVLEKRYQELMEKITTYESTRQEGI